jgi:hypothetical protein
VPRGDEAAQNAEIVRDLLMKHMTARAAVAAASDPETSE